MKSVIKIVNSGCYIVYANDSVDHFHFVEKFLAVLSGLSQPRLFKRVPCIEKGRKIAIKIVNLGFYIFYAIASVDHFHFVERFLVV